MTLVKVENLEVENFWTYEVWDHGVWLSRTNKAKLCRRKIVDLKRPPVVNKCKKLSFISTIGKEKVKSKKSNLREKA